MNAKAKSDVTDCIRRLQKINALMIAVQYAANHDAEFDVSDAMAAIIMIIEHMLTELDALEAST